MVICRASIRSRAFSWRAASGPAEALYNDVNGGCYLVARFYREDGKFIRTKQKPKQKKREGRKPKNE